MRRGPIDVLIHPEAGTNSYHHLRIRKGDIEPRVGQRPMWSSKGPITFPIRSMRSCRSRQRRPGSTSVGRVTVETSGQWAHEDRAQIAHALDLPEDQVRVIYAEMGGAFGGKEDISLQIVTALAAKVLHERGIPRRVHCRWSREESIVGHHKRHRATIDARLGATSDGRITAVEADVWLDAGAYNYTSNKVLGNAHLSVAGAYDIPNARIDSTAVYTTSVPGGAFRGFGGPQGAFVAETQMNKLAVALGMDPIELRRRNVLREGGEGITQTVMPAGVTLPEVIDACATRRLRRGERRCVLACGDPSTGCGGNPSGSGICRRLQERRLQLRVPGALRSRDPAAR